MSVEYLGLSKPVNYSKPLVSVCILAYNHEQYIERCIEGCLDQITSFPVEILIGEDQSSDNTRSICKGYAERHTDKIRLFLRTREEVIYINGKPTGRSNLINTLNACRGKYIAMCEGDDFWTDPKKLQKQVELMESDPELTLSFHSVNVLDEIKDIVRLFVPDPYPADKQVTRKHIILKGGSYIPTASVMYKSNCVVDVPDWFRNVMVGDYSMNLLAIEKGEAGYLDENMATYRRHPGGVWSSVDRSKQLEHNIASTIELIPHFPAFRNLLILRVERAYAQYSGHLMHTHQLMKLFTILREVIRSNNLSLLNVLFELVRLERYKLSEFVKSQWNSQHEKTG